MIETRRKVRSAVLAACLLLAIFVPVYSPIRNSDSPSLDDVTKILPSEADLQPVFITQSAGFQNGSSETQLKTAQDQPILFDITVLDDELVNKSVQSLAYDSVNNRLFVGTMQGLSIVDINNLSIINLTTNNGLSGSNIGGIAINENRCQAYIGFNGGYGLSIYNWTTKSVSNLSMTIGNQVLFVTSCVYYEANDLLYVGLWQRGVGIYNFTTDEFTYRNYTHGLPGNGNVWSLELDEANDILYAGTSGGLAIYDIVNDTFDVRTTDDGLPDNWICGLETDKKAGILYIGTLANSLSIYDLNNDSFSNFNVTNYTYGINGLGDFALDQLNNRMYVGGGWEGLYVYNTQDNIFTNRFTESEGIPTGVRQLAWGQELNTLFIGTNEDGLAICKITQIPAPVLLNLPEYDHDGEYALCWSSSMNATFYTLQESAEPSFSTSQTIFNGNSTVFVISNKLDGVYYYRVRASNATSNSPWSEVQWIEVIHPPDIPQIQTVSFPNIDGNYIVSWSSVTNAENYTLEEGNNSLFSSYLQIYSGTNTSFNITNKTDGTFYYRVKAVNAGGNSCWSMTSVTVIHLPGIPLLNQLPSASNNGTLKISWSLVTNSGYYVLEESSYSDFSFANIIYTGTKNFTWVTNMNDGIYYYRVKAVNLGGSSNWSIAQQITVLLLPTSPIAVLSIIEDEYKISWASIPNADYYIVVEADNPDFTSSNSVNNGTDSIFIVNKTGTHYYRVKAVNSAGESDWSNVITVSIPLPQSDPFFLPFIGTIIIIIIMASILIWQNFRKKKPAATEEEDAKD